jgi:hypothetical protein
MSKAIDLTGQRFGRLTVVSRVENIKDRTAWLCRCDCGKEKIVRGYSLRLGDTKSCGCYHGETIRKGNFVHGRSATRLYGIWNAVNSRCCNPNHEQFKDYGERGITVCYEWKTFELFYEWAIANGYRDNLTIDRIDNDGNYCPENCRWAARKEQANNRRDTIKIEFNGETRALSMWSELVGIPRIALWKRIFQRGWSVEKALTTPLQSNGH